VSFVAVVLLWYDWQKVRLVTTVEFKSMSACADYRQAFLKQNKGDYIIQCYEKDSKR
jgi:hypothetical protein